MLMLNIKTCGDCALMQHGGGICQVYKTARAPTDPGCLYHTTELHLCALCGNHMPKENQLIDATNPEDIVIYCRGCKQHVNHCPTCTNSQECRFETDPSSIPKIIQKEIRQGNMTTVMQIRNPDRIRETCKKGCPCFSEEFECLRQFNSCGNYKFILDK